MLLIIRAAAGLSQLEFLQLAGHDSDLSLTMLLANFNSVTLKELCISHYTEGIDGDPGAPWRSIEELTQSTHCGFEAAFRCSRLPQVTTLRLSEPRAPPLVTQTLVQWPARLVYLSMTYLCHSKSAAEYTVGAVQRILDVHCESLQHVVLGLIPYFKDGIPNFAHFPHLVNLQLSQYNLKSEKPYTASAKMAAPSQRHLRIDFGTEDQHKEDSKDFGAAQVQWLEEFVTTLNNGSKGVISGKLERIFIDFNPGYLLWEDHDVEDTWPWDYLEQAVQGAAKCNVALKYSTPACTRWEWDRMITRKRKGLEWRPHDDDDDDEEAPQEDND